MRASFLLVMVFALCVSDAYARIYKCVDNDGNTVYMDTPISDQCAESKEVPNADLPALIESKPAAVPTNTGSFSNSSSNKKDINDYNTVTITSPANEESLRSNEGQVIISYAATPALKSRNGHQYVILLGGKEVYRGTNTSVSLENVDRGEHVVTAIIVTANGRTLSSSEPVTFTLQRFSSLHNQNRRVTPTPLVN